MKVLAALLMATGLAACAGSGGPQTETGKVAVSLAPIVATRLYLERQPDRADEVSATAEAALAALDGDLVTLAILRAQARTAIGYDEMDPADQIILTRLADALEADIAARSGVLELDVPMSPEARARARMAIADVQAMATAMGQGG